jgi:elongation factor P--beta-lysine ligase
MTEEQLVNIAKAYIEVLRWSMNDPDHPVDAKLSSMLKTQEHCAGIAIGFVRGWRMCEETTCSRTIQPGSN